MIRSRSAPLAAVALALTSAGCIALARETYTTVRGPGAEALAPGERVPVSPGRTGRLISQAPTAARVASPSGGGLEVAVCDWDEGTWFVVFPPLPVPLLSPGDAPGVPDTTVVRIGFEGAATWRAEFARLELVGPAGERAAPIRYRLVTRELDHSREPCTREREPRSKVDRAELAIFGDAELWLTYPWSGWSDEPVALELGGITRDGQPATLPRLELDSGTRWFWYRVFP